MPNECDFLMNFIDAEKTITILTNEMSQFVEKYQMRQEPISIESKSLQNEHTFIEKTPTFGIIPDSSHDAIKITQNDEITLDSSDETLKDRNYQSLANNSKNSMYSPLCAIPSANNISADISNYYVLLLLQYRLYHYILSKDCS